MNVLHELTHTTYGHSKEDITLYKQFIRAILTYAKTAWSSGIANTHTYKLQTIYTNNSNHTPKWEVRILPLIAIPLMPHKKFKQRGALADTYTTPQPQHIGTFATLHHPLPGHSTRTHNIYMQIH